MDKVYISNIIQTIIEKEFTSSIEKRVSIHEDRINFRCPCCHEGKTKTKKRGNLYFNKLLFICFRCGEKMSLDKLCRKFNIMLDPEKKLEMIKHLESVITYDDYQDDLSDAKFENLIELDDLKKAIELNLTQLSDFKPIVENGGVYKYLCNRGITSEFHKNIYQAKYWKNEDEHEWVIVMLNRRDDKILGMQIRNLKEGKRRMFKIYNYENLLDIINLTREIPLVLDMNELVIYNKLSYYFNILNINLGKRITIFEGYIDSLFYPNSIGMVGINTDSFIIENNNLDIQYFYDNDDVGHRKAEQKIKKGFPVFLWKKLFEGIVDRKKTDDPYKLLYRISSVKDLNKLNQLNVNAYDKLKLYDYFSDGIMDLIWIPKIRNYKTKTEKDYNKKIENFKYL